MANHGIGSESETTTTRGFLSQPFETMDPLIAWIKAHQTAIQALILFLMLCLPGNLMTLVLFHRVHYAVDSSMTNGSKEFLANFHAISEDLCLQLARPPLCLLNTTRESGEGCWSSRTRESNVLLLDHCASQESLQKCLKDIVSHTQNGPVQEHRLCNEYVYEASKAVEAAVTYPPPCANGTCGISDGSSHSKPSNFTCHESFEKFSPLVVGAQFWLGGVGTIVVGVFGMAGNLMTVIVLRKIDTNIMFNKLLMTLAIFDSLYLAYHVMDNGIIGTMLRSQERPEPLWYRISYPYILCPLKWMFMTATIFMVVAISAERQRAICSPLTHRPTFWPYVLTVICIACTYNIPKFFEFSLTVNEKGEYDYTTTLLNENKSFIAFCAWWDDLIVCGIVPLVSLVVFNMRIYLKVRSSDNLEFRFVGRRTRYSSSRSGAPHQYSSSSGPDDESFVGSFKKPHLERRSKQNSIELLEMTEIKNSLDKAYGFSRPEKEIGYTNGRFLASSLKCTKGRGRQFSTRSYHGTKSTEQNTSNATSCVRSSSRKLARVNTEGSSDADSIESPIRKCGPSRSFLHHNNSEKDMDNDGGGPEEKTQHFRKRREKTARILLTIVLTFLFCHTFRFVIKAYEVTYPSHSTNEHHIFCLQQERFHVPVALYVMLSLSHLLLVVNSSINFIIYCCVGKRFRKELRLIVSSAYRKWGCRGSSITIDAQAIVIED